MKNNPAFPRPRGTGGGQYNEGGKGMTLFQYTAIQAMKGLLSNEANIYEDHDHLAIESASIAKAMIKEFEK